MGFLELLRQVITNLSSNKLRSALTMFGITWGIASVMLLSGLAQGFSEDSLKGIRAMGKDVVIVWGGRKSLATGSGRKGDQIRFDEKTNKALEAKAQLFDFSPEVSAWSTEMRAGTRIFNTRLAGVGETYGNLRNCIPDYGRWLSRRDVLEARRVCVIGNEVRKKLFGDESNPLHERVLIGGREFLIVG